VSRRPLKHFLLIYDHGRSRLIDPPASFDDASEAAEALSEAEERYSSDATVEVVLIGSDSLMTVHRTHANYFEGGLRLLEDLKSMAG